MAVAARWIILLALALALLACQGTPTPATPALSTATPAAAVPPTATPAPPVELALTCRCERGTLNNNILLWLDSTVFPAFVAQMAARGQPVTLTVNEFTGSDEALREMLREQLAAGRGGDLLLIDGFWIADFADAGLLQPLAEVAGPEVAKWEGWAHISPGLQNLLAYQGEVYGLALGTDTRAIFYRRDLFERAGIPTPWQPRSWQELLDTARTLKRELPGVIPLQINAGTAMGEATTMQGYFPLLLGAGSHVYDFGAQKWITRSPAIEAALDFYQTVYVEEALGDVELQVAPDGRERSFAAFRDGDLAMLIESDFFWRAVLAPGSEYEMADRNALVDWAKIPAVRPNEGYNGQTFVTISGGTGIVINPNSDHPALAWELLSFMFSREMLTAFQEIEPRIRIRNDVPVVGDSLMTDMGRDLLPLTTVRPALPTYAAVSEQIQLMTERVVTGQMTVPEAVDAYAAAVNDIVGEENSSSLP